MIINQLKLDKSPKDLFKVDSLIFTDSFSYKVFELVNDGLDGEQLQEKILELETKQ